MPALRIIDILFDSSDVDNNKLGIAIFYRVPEIGFKDLLTYIVNSEIFLNKWGALWIILTDVHS